MLLVLLKTDFDSKITEVEGKIPNISGLATNSSLTAVENKIPDVTNLILILNEKTLVIELLKINQRTCFLIMSFKIKNIF